MVADDDGGELGVDAGRFPDGSTLADELLGCGGAGACRLRRRSVDMGDDKVEHSEDDGD